MVSKLAGEMILVRNVDKFCQAALRAFQHGAAETYSMTGSYRLTTLVNHLAPDCRRQTYSDWYATVAARCQSSDGPLAALLPHLQAEHPPFTSFHQELSAKCRQVLGDQLADELREVSGYAAFARALDSPAEPCLAAASSLVPDGDRALRLGCPIDSLTRPGFGEKASRTCGGCAAGQKGLPEPTVPSGVQVKKLPCASGQFFGRLMQRGIKSQIGQIVGRFVEDVFRVQVRCAHMPSTFALKCGSPIIGEELGRQSVKNSDVIGTPGATRFSFFKETTLKPLSL
ncbi:car [Symbiodinium natans]|uniref:Car protein n=1 Tax=Symbiodinium natans TaxID=878477 RepID=A0A812M1V5_9DINO|nr:car [Symbiodinium natans]